MRNLKKNLVSNMTREEAIKEAYGIPVTKTQHEALQLPRARTRG